MALGLIGKKVGMTRVFTEHGESRAVTVIEATPNRITQVKNDASDGYDAVQVTIGTRRATRVTQAMRGHFAKAGVEPGRGVWEFRLAQPAENQAGGELTVEMFSQGEMVDVTGRSIGKGFAGPMKRYGFRGGRATHGNSKAHRLGGSIGNAQDPGRVFKGKKMAGHMGAVQRVQQGLEVVRVDQARNLLLISGSIPGAKGADVIVQPSVKGKAPRTTPAPQKDVSEDVDNVSAKDSSKDSGKDSGKDSNKDSNKDASNVSDKHSAQDLNKDSSKDASKDSDKKSAKASNKDASKNAGNDANKSSNKKADK